MYPKAPTARDKALLVNDWLGFDVVLKKFSDQVLTKESLECVCNVLPC